MTLLKRINLWLAISLLQLLLCQPVFAQSDGPPDQPPTQAVQIPPLAPPCQTFAGGMDDDTLHFLHRLMRNGFVVQHTPVIDSIDLEVAPDSQQLMPVLWTSAVAGDRQSLQVPDTFMQDICTIIEFNIAYYGHTEEYRQLLAAQLQDCALYPDTAARCVVDLMAANGAPWAYVSESINPYELQLATSLSLLIRMTTLQTAQYILAHESGHAVIRSTHSPEQLELINEEYEADLLAQLAVMDTSVLPIGPLSVLAAQAVIENGRYSEQDLHPPAFCRLQDASNLFLGNLRRVMALSTLRSTTQSTFNIGQSDELAGNMAQMLPIVPLTEPPTGSCQPEAPDRIAGFSNDIAQLEGILRAAQTGQVTSQEQAQQLAMLGLETAEGRRLATLITMELSVRSPEMTALAASAALVPSSAQARQSALELLRGMNSVLAPIDRQNLRPVDLSDLIKTETTVQLYLNPPGSQGEVAFAQFFDQFEGSFRYNDLAAVLENLIVFNRMFPDMEVVSAANIERTIGPYVVYIMTSGQFKGCGPYLQLARFAQTINPAMTQSEADLTATCISASHAAVQEMTRNLGWVWSDQAASSSAAQ